jgi:hypothetical protein
MTSDNQFTALGPSIVGFQTNATRIDRGAQVAGTKVGVIGSCTANGADPDSVGVRGEGSLSSGDNQSPGTGVLGRGGMRHPGLNTARAMHGAGVVGVAGGVPHPGQDPRPIPPHSETGHVGVFGQGGDGEKRGSVSGAGLSGPDAAGPGVVGHGGLFRNVVDPSPQDNPFSDGTGVVGVSGSFSLPEATDSHPAWASLASAEEPASLGLVQNAGASSASAVRRVRGLERVLQHRYCCYPKRRRSAAARKITHLRFPRASRLLCCRQVAERATCLRLRAGLMTLRQEARYGSAREGNQKLLGRPNGVRSC